MKFWPLLLLSFLVSVAPVFAQDNASAGSGSQLTQFLNRIVSLLDGLIYQIILPIASGLVVAMVIYGGIQMIMGQKDNGKKTITASITGAIIIILSYAFVRLLQSIL